MSGTAEGLPASEFVSRGADGNSVIVVDWTGTTPEQWRALAVRAVVVRVKAAAKQRKEKLPERVEVRAVDYVRGLRASGGKLKRSPAERLAAQARELPPEERARLRAALDDEG